MTYKANYKPFHLKGLHKFSYLTHELIKSIRLLTNHQIKLNHQQHYSAQDQVIHLGYHPRAKDYSQSQEQLNGFHQKRLTRLKYLQVAQFCLEELEYFA